MIFISKLFYTFSHLHSSIDHIQFLATDAPCTCPKIADWQVYNEWVYWKSTNKKGFSFLTQDRGTENVKLGDLALFLVYFMISYLTATTQPLDTQNVWQCALAHLFIFKKKQSLITFIYSLFKDHQQRTFVTFNRFFLLSKNPTTPLLLTDNISSGNRRIQQHCIIQQFVLSNLTTLWNWTSLPISLAEHVCLQISKQYQH